MGLFGGTFNPIHWGHLRSAEEIRERFKLSQIFFIPARIPPHKKVEVVSSEHRFEMVKMAIDGNPHFQASDIELRRPGKSYSFETICQFHGLFNHSFEIFFIMGVDAFREIHTWKDYPHLFSTCHFIVMARPGFSNDQHKAPLPNDVISEFNYNSKQECFMHTSGHRVHFCAITSLEISSTAIRDRVKSGESIKYLVPETVQTYIENNCLYQGI